MEIIKRGFRSGRYRCGFVLDSYRYQYSVAARTWIRIRIEKSLFGYGETKPQEENYRIRKNETNKYKKKRKLFYQNVPVPWSEALS